MDYKYLKGRKYLEMEIESLTTNPEPHTTGERWKQDTRRKLEQ